MRQPRFIIFDFDGTLVDSQHLITHCMGEAFRAEHLSAPEIAQVRRIVGLRLEQAILKLLPEPDEHLAEALSGHYRKAFFALRDAPEFHEPLFEGMVGLLERLTLAGRVLGIATGKNRRGLVKSLEVHGLAHHFSILRTADDGPGKPDPAILVDAMLEADARPEESVMIGDTVYDMRMAKAAKVHAIGVSWGYHEIDELLQAGASLVVGNAQEQEQHLLGHEGEQK